MINVDERVELDVVRSYVNDLQLKMKPVKIEFIGEGKDRRFFVYFVAKKRVNFNVLVRRLYGRYRCRIEMRWISTREHAMLIEGGMSVCSNCVIPCFQPWCQKNRFGGCYYDKPNDKSNCKECKEQCS
jgi:cell fate regulator YaaT (PSP1 superfamily)